MRRLPWRWRYIVGIVVALVVVIVAVGVPVYVAPQVDQLRHADAIVVLGGHDYERYPYGLELALSGYAPEIAMSNPAGSEDIWLTDMCRHQRYPFHVSCFEPDPPTTRGEAQEIGRLARAHHWQSIIVVTFRPHISRARYIISRCYDGELIMSDSKAAISVGDWAWNYLYQTAGYIRASLQSGC